MGRRLQPNGLACPIWKADSTVCLNWQAYLTTKASRTKCRVHQNQIAKVMRRATRAGWRVCSNLAGESDEVGGQERMQASSFSKGCTCKDVQATKKLIHQVKEKKALESKAG